MEEIAKGFIRQWLVTNFQRWMTDNVRGYRGGFIFSGFSLFTEFEKAVNGKPVTEEDTALEFLQLKEKSRLKDDGQLVSTLRVKSCIVEVLGSNYQIAVSNLKQDHVNITKLD